MLQNLLWKRLILRGQDMTTMWQLQHCIFGSSVPSFLIIMQFEPSAPNSDKHSWRLNNGSLNTGLLFLISSSVSFDLSIQFVVVTTIRAYSVRLNWCPDVFSLEKKWTMRSQTLSSLGFFCRGAFVAWKTVPRCLCAWTCSKGIVVHVCKTSCLHSIMVFSFLFSSFFFEVSTWYCDYKSSAIINIWSVWLENV